MSAITWRAEVTTQRHRQEGGLSFVLGRALKVTLYTGRVSNEPKTFSLAEVLRIAQLVEALRTFSLHNPTSAQEGAARKLATLFSLSPLPETFSLLSDQLLSLSIPLTKYPPEQNKEKYFSLNVLLLDEKSAITEAEVACLRRAFLPTWTEAVSHYVVSRLLPNREVSYPFLSDGGSREEAEEMVSFLKQVYRENRISPPTLAPLKTSFAPLWVTPSPRIGYTYPKK